MTVCYAAGETGTILATKDGGVSWQRQSSGTTIPLLEIACPGVRICFAPLGGPCGDSRDPPALLKTSDGGGAWTSRRLPACIFRAFACPSVTTCYYVSPAGEVLRRVDGGESWQDRGPITWGKSNQPGALALACPSATVCYAGGEYVIGRTEDGAASWRVSHFESIDPSCTSKAICVDFMNIACPTTAVCYAAASGDDEVATTRDGGQTWRRRRFPHLLPIDALSCPTPRRCFGLARTVGPSYRTVVLQTTDGGDTWRRAPVMGGYPFFAIACPGRAACFAGGALGRLASSVDGGQSWRDLLPALFVTGTFGVGPEPHTYSRWFTAARPWRVTLGIYADSSRRCEGLREIAVYIQNAAGEHVAGPIRSAAWGFAQQYERGVRVRGRLRLDVVSPHCSSFLVRVDGVR